MKILKFLGFVGKYSFSEFNLFIETPGYDPELNPCQLKHQHWVRRPNPEFNEYFLKVWKRKDGQLVSEEVPMHVSEYLKPSALWIFHPEGKFQENFDFCGPQILY